MVNHHPMGVRVKLGVFESNNLKMAVAFLLSGFIVNLVDFTPIYCSLKIQSFCRNYDFV